MVTVTMAFVPELVTDGTLQLDSFGKPEQLKVTVPANPST